MEKTEENHLGRGDAVWYSKYLQTFRGYLLPPLSWEATETEGISETS